MATGLAIAPLAVAVYGAQHGAMAPRTVALASSGAIAIISLAISIIPIGAVALGTLALALHTLALALHTVNPLLLCMRHEVGTHERRGWYPKNSRAPLLLKLRPAAAAAAAAAAASAAAAGIGIGALISHAIIRNQWQSGALISHAIIRNQAVVRGGGGEAPVSLG